MLRLILLITPFWIAIESKNITIPLSDPLSQPIRRENGAPTIEVTLYDYKRIVYYGIVGIGTPPQYFKLQFDTGSPVIWVCNVHWVKGLSMIQNKYNPLESSTHGVKNNWFYAEYGNFIVSGYTASDITKVHTGSIRTDFAVVDNHKGLSAHLKFTDGLFGLAAGQTHRGFQSTALDDMHSQGLINRRMFSFVFKPGGVDGTLIFGEYSRRQIPGRVYHVPLVPSSPSVKHWIVQVESITCEDGTVLLENFSALLDTGSTKSYLPPPFVNRLFSGDWAMPDENGDISCDAMLEMPGLKVNLPELQLSWGAMQYIIQLETTWCQPGIKAISPGLPAEAILGMSFLRHYVTVFDVDNARVGFAETV